MSGKQHVARFAELRSSDLGDPHGLADDRLKVLWVLATTKDDQTLDYITPAQIADILCDGEGIRLSRQRVASILEGEKQTVARKRTRGKRFYKIMKLGTEQLGTPGQAAMYVDPEQALTQIRRMEEILAGLKGDLKVCDPYIENRTLDFLAECKASTGIRLLSANVLKEPKLRRDFAAFQKEHKSKLQIRLAAPGLIHDRYVLHADGMILLGTSLNGFAKKQSFVVSLGPDIRGATEAAFDRFWDSASKF